MRFIFILALLLPSIVFAGSFDAEKTGEYIGTYQPEKIEKLTEQLTELSEKTDDASLKEFIKMLNKNDMPHVRNQVYKLFKESGGVIAQDLEGNIFIRDSSKLSKNKFIKEVDKIIKQAEKTKEQVNNAEETQHPVYSFGS